MSAAELIESPDPLAEEVGKLVHRTVHDQPVLGLKWRAARLFCTAGLLLVMEMEGAEAAELAAAKMMRRFAKARVEIPGSVRRRK